MADSKAQFYMGTLPDVTRSAEEGRPVFKDVPFVRIVTPGDATNIVDQPVWDEPRNPNSHTGRFPAEWAAFKANAKAPESGTPLDMMPGITKAQVAELKHFEVRTIEDLANLSDAHAGRFMGINGMRTQARDYLERAKGAAPDKALRAAVAQKDAELEALRTQMAALSARLDETAPPPAKRGRPRKSAEA